MKLNKKNILPLVIVSAAVAAIALIVNNPPKPARGMAAKPAQMAVETQLINGQTFDVVIDSFGVVQPRTQSVLVAQASGQINEVSSQFRDGGFFEAGDILVKLDDRDHKAEVKIAQSSLMSAKQALFEEQARVKQALADWQRLGNGQQANALVLREPQLEAAKAKVLSAEAQLEKAQLTLERTQIVAPYAGRILKKHVDLGQVVNNNTQLADIYAVDYVEIRLPIKNKDLQLIKLPEQYRDVAQTPVGSDVTFKSDLVQAQTWQGQVVRTESAIDSQSQQLYVVAQIDDPYQAKLNQISPIKIGQYVSAKIKGKTLSDVIVIPNSAIYQGSYVYTVENDVLKRKEISLSWQNAEQAIVSEGLGKGDQLVLTPLGQVSSGTPVKMQNANTSAAPQDDKAARRAKLEQMAKERGITVEQLMAERKKARAQREGQ
ncbi:efflux RND transporter periplasmic adaptor subunit [Pseudoalteromonas tunicata]|uniref:Efflux transporter, RND family, MFP subunit n=1 Tax=Pseudoalteromonas tunicata D2 TaxID=87626 RepID=A4CCL5_9GAMM|nr:efflux RND transporter periplasmic adaptor subunit [Pseudoalteromonas tunicata]ATC93809.1 hypothetical protein PTUN_a1131 [Pseudoalteromonas tunicata]AXT29628.1 efflux RND transporter periplasmic adaptor subunit [Pseudoalteromonas tunicata]EAR27308.1 efflux transporter, RND family, MFP subunit [Pseudoalteromonas tunicata D2]